VLTATLRASPALGGRKQGLDLFEDQKSAVTVRIVRRSALTEEGAPGADTTTIPIG
jgi:hypothetical protein